MTEKETRELIELLRLIAEDSVGYVLLNRAADALEDTLWKPIAGMPEKLMDGREVLLGNSISKDTFVCCWDFGWVAITEGGDSYSFVERATHYREITAPEQEKADE